MIIYKSFIILCFLLIFFSCALAILYPYDSETRDKKSLNGLWTFKISADYDIGFRNSWNNVRLEELGDTLKMPVPASFNDVTANATIRDFLGWSWYQRSFYVPHYWQVKTDRRIFVHFGGVHYTSKVWLNGALVGEHVGGYLPFQVELTDNLKVGTKNNITVAVNNILHKRTLPQATIQKRFSESKNAIYTLVTMNCDYYNYAGIHRPVTLFITPKVYICDLNIVTGYNKNKGYVNYEIKVCGGKEDICHAKLFDNLNIVVAKLDSCEGKLEFDDVKLWWPIMSNHTSIAYMYEFEARIISNKTSEDIYRLPVGIRTINWNSSAFLINDEPVYFHGLGMHEDSNIRGRGFDYSVLIRDLSLMKWLGANSIRTSNYPYAEEMLIEADSHGLLVIMEAPACSLDHFGDDMFVPHKEVVQEMVLHYKNRPSIIMWSLANEPADLKTAVSYFRTLVAFTKSLDSTRPVTLATGIHPNVNEKSPIQYMDVICINLYFGWYKSSGRLDLIQLQLIDEFKLWEKMYNKPILISEYGAGSITGFHDLPSSLWTEDYHADLMLQHFKAFDILRSEGSLIGEMVWSFIDFKVQQDYFRPAKCSKGLFTKERQPKAASHVVRSRYLNLGQGTSFDYHYPSIKFGVRDIQHDSVSNGNMEINENCSSLYIICIILLFLCNLIQF
ncbi:beta-glucuronidase-like [Lycorma delicatula]|uniref:beta-glucuronidase-like n=1 Tax=Lycorma delicatula TaxID=130591 RepID=UPI003F5118D2